MTDAELDDRLAELSLRQGLLPAATIERARTFQKSRGSTLAGAFATLQLIPGDTLRAVLEEITGSRGVDPSLMTVYPDFVARVNQLLPASLVARLLVFPAQMEANALHVCMLNPTDGWTVRALEAVSGCRVFPMVAHEVAVVSALTQHYAGFLPGTTFTYQPEGGEAAAEEVYRSILETPFNPPDLRLRRLPRASGAGDRARHGRRAHAGGDADRRGQVALLPGAGAGAARARRWSISPLIALMHDQIRAAEAFGHPRRVADLGRRQSRRDDRAAEARRARPALRRARAGDGRGLPRADRAASRWR